MDYSPTLGALKKRNVGRSRKGLLCAAVMGMAMVVPGGEASADPASDLAARLSELQMGNSYVRLRVAVNGSDGGKSVLQVQIKGRRTPESADFLYQVLWPKERKGESVLLRQTGGGAPTGHLFQLPDKQSALTGQDLRGSLFGTDISYEDITENFFAWKQQAIVGTETVERKECQILESKPGAGQSSSYGSVRSWVDTERMVPLRVEKYDAAGRLVRRIDTTRVNKNDKGKHIPSTLSVRRAGGTSVTEFEGARDDLDVRYADEVFTVGKMTDLSPPR